MDVKMDVCECGIVKCAHVELCSVCREIQPVATLKADVKAANKAAIKAHNLAAKRM